MPDPINEEFDIEFDKDWLSPLNVPALANAVANGETSVTLTGRRFNINYASSTHVFVRVQGNFAPCGWFSKEELARYEFEADHDKHL